MTTHPASLGSPASRAPRRPAPREQLGLRDVLGAGVLVGCAIDGGLPAALRPVERKLLCHHFNALTPENLLKPGNAQPTEGRFNLRDADATVAFARANNLAVIGHCLMWHQQCPDWFFKNGGAAASRDLLLARMEKHIDTVVGRYRGMIHGWDVFNEAIAEPGDYLRDTPFTQIAGPDVIADAFRMAHAADPDAELYYNDFNIEVPDKRERTLRLLRELLDAGVRVDAVGIQGHWLLDRVPFDDLEAAIEAFHALGLKVMITELDLDVVERPDCGADVAVHHDYSVADDVYRQGCPDEVLRRQAEQYAKLFDLIRRHADKVARVSFWGLHDGRSWLNYWPGERTNHPLLFDRDCRPKIAYDAVARMLESHGPKRPA